MGKHTRPTDELADDLADESVDEPGEKDALGEKDVPLPTETVGMMDVVAATRDAERRRQERRHRHHHGHGGHGHDDSARADARPRRNRRNAVLKVLIAIFVVIGVAAGGAAYALNRSVERGRQALHEARQQQVDNNAGTIEFEGHHYRPNQNVVTAAFIGFDGRTQGKEGQDLAGQSDTVMVLAMDTETGKSTAIVVPRDSMVTVDEYVGGAYVGQTTQQLCLQYSYGETPEQSSELVASCVSRVLMGTPIDYYFTLDIAGVGPINDSIGGVTVVPTQDIPGTDIVAGQEMTLFGQAAGRYVQWRDTDDPESSLKRQARQISYVKSFSASVLSAAKANPTIMLDLYQTSLDYTWTNLGVDEFSYLASVLVDKGVGELEVRTLAGELTHGEKYAEYNLDQADVQRCVLDVFYTPVD